MDGKLPLIRETDRCPKNVEHLFLTISKNCLYRSIVTVQERFKSAGCFLLLLIVGIPFVALVQYFRLKSNI